MGLTVLGAVQAPIVYADGSTSQQVFDASYNRLTGSLPPFLASSTVPSFIKSEIFLQVCSRVILSRSFCEGLQKSCRDAASVVQQLCEQSFCGTCSVRVSQQTAQMRPVLCSSSSVPTALQTCHGGDAALPPHGRHYLQGATMACHANSLRLVNCPHCPSGTLHIHFSSLLQQLGCTSSHAVPSPCQ